MRVPAKSVSVALQKGRLATMSASFLLLLALFPIGAAAQTTYATITGTVTDASGAVIDNATVVATNVETSVTTKTTTHEDDNQ
jgi:hypothetical protein